MIENLRIGRVVVHEVFQRDQSKRIVPPLFGQQLEQLSFEAIEAFRQRAVDALSVRSKSVQMAIIRDGEGTFMSDVDALLGTSDADFLTTSRRVAARLAEAQLSQNIPGGMLIVFDGTVGAASHGFVGVIKAEIQDGFRRRREGEAITTEFINDLFLTRAQRLFKVGLMIRIDPQNGGDPTWEALVFDHNIVSGNREAAAQYFYESFMGCGFPADGAYETTRFFDLTKEFVVKTVPDREERHDLIDALYTYVKSDHAPTFSFDEFGERHVPQNLQDRYEAFMTNRRFPARAVVRDTSHMAGKLRRRRFKYGTDIEFSVAPEALAEGRALIETFQAVGEHVGRPEVWTRITIKAPFAGET